MKRHNARIMAVQYLYAWDFNQTLEEEQDELFNNLKDIYEESLETEHDWDIDFIFAKNIIEGTIKNINEIDDIITNNLEKWTIDRLSYVDRAIIRLATYELKFTKTPYQIIVNEAIEITKDYCNLDNNDQSKFNNRVIDKIRKTIYE